jgi:hypothetical protein
LENKLIWCLGIFTKDSTVLKTSLRFKTRSLKGNAETFVIDIPIKSATGLTNPFVSIREDGKSAYVGGVECEKKENIYIEVNLLKKDEFKEEKVDPKRNPLELSLSEPNKIPKDLKDKIFINYNIPEN